MPLTTELREAAFALPVEERLALADELKRSAAPMAFGLSPEFVEELDRRASEMESGQEPGTSWEEIQEEWKRDRS